MVPTLPRGLGFVLAALLMSGSLGPPLWASAGLPASALPGGTARIALFGPVSETWARRVQGGLINLQENRFFENARPSLAPLLALLRGLDVTDPEQRRLLAPMVRDLTESWGFNYEFPPTMTTIFSGKDFRLLQVLERGQDRVEGQLKEVLARAEKARSIEDLSDALAWLQQIEFFSAYFHQGRLKDLQDARAWVIVERARREAELLGLSGDPGAVAGNDSEARVGLAMSLLKALAKAQGKEEVERRLGQLRELAAVDRMDLNAHHAILNGLLDYIGRAPIVTDAQRALETLEAVASLTPAEPAQAYAVRRLAEEPLRRGSRLFEERVLEALTKIAVASPHLPVKRAALGHLQRKARAAASEDRRQLLEAMAGRIEASAGGKIEPAAPQPEPGGGEVPPVGRRFSLGEVWGGVKDSPQGAFFHASALAATALSMAAAGFPWPAVAAALLAMLAVSAAGLAARLPVPAFFHVLLQWAYLALAAYLGGLAWLSAAGPLALLAAGGVLAALMSVWSFSRGRPAEGLLANLALYGWHLFLAGWLA